MHVVKFYTRIDSFIPPFLTEAGIDLEVLNFKYFRFIIFYI